MESVRESELELTTSEIYRPSEYCAEALSLQPQAAK